mmetsp:Transcript_3127/g.9402  ORF Transcript_3127/g.9402 Transcript_3127/m.9402 type:complete len:423 (-) Transcript_3127:140-1408(-)
MNDRSGFLRPPSPSRVGVLLQVSGDPVYGEGKGPFRNPGEAYSKVPGLTGVAVPARREEDLGVLRQTSPKPLLLLPSALPEKLSHVDPAEHPGGRWEERDSRRFQFGLEHVVARPQVPLVLLQEPSHEGGVLQGLGHQVRCVAGHPAKVADIVHRHQQSPVLGVDAAHAEPGRAKIFGEAKDGVKPLGHQFLAQLLREVWRHGHRGTEDLPAALGGVHAVGVDLVRDDVKPPHQGPLDAPVDLLSVEDRAKGVVGVREKEHSRVRARGKGLVKVLVRRKAGRPGRREDWHGLHARPHPEVVVKGRVVRRGNKDLGPAVAHREADVVNHRAAPRRDRETLGVDGARVAGEGLLYVLGDGSPEERVSAEGGVPQNRVRHILHLPQPLDHHSGRELVLRDQQDDVPLRVLLGPLIGHGLQENVQV